ncbi:hypothetical protein [Shewanella algae]|uniref:hypothetical protein n=1 Tax=Shewanella algae TaxID=38313 RepID=UPI001182E54C|nr:hypothetical protein [Shewanella algae]MBC8795153.1 hypothetical protein [Shewanella algae]TVL51046.1 hypothetical protein AYJ00_08075 [Shewanella algae]
MGLKTVVVKTELLQTDIEKEYQRKYALYEEAIQKSKGLFKTKPAPPKKPSPSSILRSVIDEVALQAKLDNTISDLYASGYSVVSLTPVQSSNFHVDPINSKSDVFGEGYQISGGGSIVVPYTSAIIILASKT